VSSKNRNPARHGRSDAGDSCAAVGLAWVRTAQSALASGSSPSDINVAQKALTLATLALEGDNTIPPPVGVGKIEEGQPSSEGMGPSDEGAASKIDEYGDAKDD